MNLEPHGSGESAGVALGRTFNSTFKLYVRWYLYSGLLLLLVILPLLAPTKASRSIFSGGGEEVLFKYLLSVVPFLGVFAISRFLTQTKRELRAIACLCLLAAGLCELVHYWGTDRAHAFPATMWENNTAWQLFMHKGIMLLDPAYLPHSYRFLPDCVVTIFMRLTGDFVFSRILYRFTANALIFTILYGYARFYLSRFGSGLVIVLTVVLYPATILTYAGQFVDPASHLSFIICLYCLANGSEAGMIPTIVLGVLAKESVIVMAICRCFYGKKRLRSCMLAMLYLAIGLATAIVVRLVVNGGTFGYNNISGVSFQHVIENFLDYKNWGPLYFFTVGISSLGAMLGWKYMDRSFKLTTLFLGGALFISSLIFSWLAEVRNMVPALLPLIVAFVKYIENESDLGFNRVVRIGGDKGSETHSIPLFQKQISE